MTEVAAPVQHLTSENVVDWYQQGNVENMDALATPTAASPVLYGAPAPPGDLLPWSWAEQRLVAARHYWIATTRPDGRPHSRPVWGAWLPDGFWFSTARWPGTTSPPTRSSPCTWSAATRW
jgi:Pyridoxamine 5'-phosphate oxidase